eukprot:scaffold90882_cov48-Phaeocystis_antarctica.AAC.3
MIFESNRSSISVSWWNSSTTASSILCSVSENSSKSSTSPWGLEPWSGPNVQDPPSRAAAARDMIRSCRRSLRHPFPRRCAEPTQNAAPMDAAKLARCAR